MVTAYKVIGKPLGRVEGPLKVTGAAKYVADVSLPGTLWGRTLRSPYAHALIKSVNIERALLVPGVHAILTAQDVKGIKIGTNLKDMPVLAEGKVRYIGERVAAVAAETEEAADEALALIEINYEELPSVLDPIEAMKADAPIVHETINSYVGVSAGPPGPGALPGLPPVQGQTNVIARRSFIKGNVEEGFKEADRIFENEFRSPWSHQSHLEPHAALVDATGNKVKVWATHKTPYSLRRQLAAAAGIQPSDIVIYPSFIGGDFGAKAFCPEATLCYFLSKASNRPVRMVADYSEEFLAGNPRHPSIIRLKTGVKNDGSIVAFQATVVFNEGAYGAYKPMVMIGGASMTPGPYRIPNVHVQSFMVYTNTVPCGFYRAPGCPQGVFAGESQVDIVARALGMDPADFRKKNLVGSDEEDPMGAKHHNLKLAESLDAALKASDYYLPKKPGVGRGIGLGLWHASGGESHCFLTLEPTGALAAKTSATDVGGGAHTVVQAVVAEELGIPIERISVTPVDTDGAPNDSGSGASWGTRIHGMAAQSAALNLKSQLRDIASNVMGWKPDEISFQDGNVTGPSGRSIPLSELVRRHGRTISVAGTFNDRTPVHVVPTCAQVAEVEVDRETGRFRITRITSANDSGRVINKLGYEGQIDGGIIQGLGFLAMEELKMEDGRIATTNFGDYKLPTIMDIPDLKRVILEFPAEGAGPFGAKNIGELPHIPIAAAIANAIEDACGVRIKEVPITAEKIYKSLQANSSERSATPSR